MLAGARSLRCAAALLALGVCPTLADGAPTETASSEPPVHHLVYLHGRVVQDQQSARAVHPAFGVYDLEAIVAAFRARGFTVHAAIRPKAETIDVSAAKTATEIRALVEAGVPIERIALVGASMGASIALEAAELLAMPELRVVLLGACLAPNVEALRAAGGRGPSGRVLAVREASDENTDGCARWSERANGAALQGRELEIDTGLRHGFLYRPHAAWLDPTVAWLRSDPPAGSSTGS